jgi:23S rRNA pseudouridine1911/1915/1917 synthase
MPFIVKTFTLDEPTFILPFLKDALQFDDKQVRRLISKGRVRLDGNTTTAAYKRKEGKLEVLHFCATKSESNPIFITPKFALFDKPSGTMVHPSRMDNTHTLLDDIKYHFGPSANLAHRIDQETSGLVLISRSRKEEAKIKSLFEDKLIQKSYLLYAKGKVEKAQTITSAIRKMVRVDDYFLTPTDPEGKSASTIITPLKYFPDLNITLVEAKPITGRTHQIRIHLYSIGHPILGETFYGHLEAERSAYIEERLSVEERIEITGAKRLMLHANSVKFAYEKNRYKIVSQFDFAEEGFLKEQVGLI